MTCLHRISIAWRSTLALALIALAPLPVIAEQSDMAAWNGFLRQQYFNSVPIVEDHSVVELNTPYRAEDAAFTPVTIRAKFPQSATRYIQKIYVFVDDNPEPLAGLFTLTPDMGRADLALRVRVNQYTYVRAVAVLNNGETHMVANYVKAQGGCSAPLGSDFKAALAQMGTIKFRTLGEPGAEDARLGQLLLSHPNVTGMQKDQKTQLVRPAHYVKTIHVWMDNKLIMTAETGIAISEDPSFRFFFRGKPDSQLRAEFTDSQGMSWSHAFKVGG